MPSTNSNSLFLALFLAATLSGCAANATPALTPAAISSVAALQSDLSVIFGAPEFERMTWGVSVRSVATSQRLFEFDSKKLLMPASNMKILTLAAAAERLGWDYRFETRLVSCAPIENGTLKGDLIVIGDGDPTIGDRAGDALGGHLFDRWADQLSMAGIQSIEGGLIGDDGAFEQDGIGAGWAWDDLAYSYAAPVSALTYDSNAAELLVRPAATAGGLANLTIRPAESELIAVNDLTTSSPGGESVLELRRNPGSSWLIARGTIPQDAPELSRTVSVDNPTDFFVLSLRRVLGEHHINVAGPGIDIDTILSRPDVSGCRVLISHRSVPLSEIAAPMMKLSLNLYAETLLKTLGRGQAQPGTARQGSQVVRSVLDGWGIDPDSFVLSDGSGLSRYNYVATESVVSILQHIALDPKHAAPFRATLPVAGQDGTLGNRMKGTAAEGNVQAKTGSLTGVRALSGYVRTREGELLAFSMIVNGSNVAAGMVDAAADRALARLADFRRQAGPR